MHKSHFRPHCTEVTYNASNEASEGNATKRLLNFEILPAFQEIEPLATTAEFVRRSCFAIAQGAVAQLTPPATLDFAAEGTGS